MITLKWGALSILLPRASAWLERRLGLCAFEGARNRRRKGTVGERKSRIRIPKKSEERVFEARILMKNIISGGPRWRFIEAKWCPSPYLR